MRRLVVGFLMLCTGAYLDTMRGPLLTVLQGELAFSHTAGGLVLVAASVAAIGTTLLLNPLFERLGERRVAQGALALAVLGALSGFAVHSYAAAVGQGLLLGACAAALGTTSNIFVVRGSHPESLGRNLCGLHTMYGAGSALAPAALSAVLGRDIPWPWALVGLPLLLAVAAISIVPADVADPAEAADGGPAEPMGGLAALILLTIALYVCGEVLCSLWMTSYLVEATGATTETAAPILSGFFGMMFATRLVAFFGLRPSWERPMLWVSLALALAGQGLGLLGAPWGLVLAGGMGLYFPVFFARVSRLFPKRWRALAVWMIAATQIGLVIMNVAMGRLADAVGLEAAYWLPFAAMAACAACTGLYMSAESRAQVG